jgi:CRP-like cAMP-binding protein
MVMSRYWALSCLANWSALMVWQATIIQAQLSLLKHKVRGLSASEFNLPMSRQDIGNYLGLAIETVSRLFAHFQDEKLLTVNRKKIKILDHAKLKSLVDGCIGHISESA